MAPKNLSMPRSNQRPGQPKYEALLAQLREGIVSGALKPGSSLKSESQLCSEFGVSRGPVRQALSELERDRLIYRVPGKGTFVSERVIARPASRHLSLHVLIDATAGLDDNFVALEMIEGLSGGMSRLGVNGRLHYEFHRFGSVSELEVQSLLDGNDGVLVAPFTSHCVRFLEGLPAGGPPVVAMFDRVGTKSVSNFFVDHEGAAYRATELLIRYGHRRIGFLTDAATPTSVATIERVEGYRRAMEEAGLGVDPSCVVGGGIEPATIRRLTRDLLSQDESPTALLIGGGMLTGACMQTIRSLKLKVPTDVSVVAFDDTPEACLHEPPLTVVKQPLKKLAERALEQLLEAINQPARPVVQVGLGPEIILRESCSSVSARV